MIAAAERAELRQSAFVRALGDSRGVRAFERAAGLREFGVARFPVAVLDHPARAFHQHAVQVARADLHEARAARAARHVAEDLVDQLPQRRPDVALGQSGPHQPHAAIDVEADAAGRHDAAAPYPSPPRRRSESRSPGECPASPGSGPTMPGSVATFIACSSERSLRICSISGALAYTTTSVRMPRAASRGMR